MRAANLAMGNCGNEGFCFLIRSLILSEKIEAKLHGLYPKDWIPLYFEWSPSRNPYSEAYAQGKLQDNNYESRDGRSADLQRTWNKLDYEGYYQQMETSKAVFKSDLS